MINSIQNLYEVFLLSKKITTDSRNIPEGAVFFALRGENFNGNDFAEKAVGNGASIAVVDDQRFLGKEKYVVVQDTLLALQELAKLYRKDLKAKFIGITGSNGKTTTKELIREVLTADFKVQATVGNFNNHIGVPLTILSLSSDLDFAIIEMGANHIGEIARLCEITQPDFGLITNIGKAHLEGFGSFEGVIKAKSELYKYMNKAKGPVFINSDNQLLESLSGNLGKISYGKNTDAFCSGEVVSSFPFLEIKTKNEIIVSTSLVGIYNFENVMASLCVGKYFGIDEEKIKQAIESYKPDNNRSQVIETKNNTLIMDAYNANPTSMEAAINNFSESTYENKILILGEMLELGKDSKKEHELIVELALKGNFEQILLSGNEYSDRLVGDNILMFKNSDKLASYLEKKRITNKTILVKGSRGNKLEKIQKFL
jgi:UDP-N-acetylmuramoyl-tripeptide--D-alanyl-D-alanine ligase